MHFLSVGQALIFCHLFLFALIEAYFSELFAEGLKFFLVVCLVKIGLNPALVHIRADTVMSNSSLGDLTQLQVLLLCVRSQHFPVSIILWVNFFILVFFEKCQSGFSLLAAKFR